MLRRPEARLTGAEVIRNIYIGVSEKNNKKMNQKQD